MAPLNYSQIVLFGLFVSVLGWALETIWFSLVNRNFSNRGILLGPYCLIYGVAAIVLVVFYNSGISHPVWIFLLSAGLTGLIDVIMNKMTGSLFQFRRRDPRRIMRHKKVVGVISALAVYGALGLFAIYFLLPLFDSWIAQFPLQTQRLMSSSVIALLIIDFIKSLSDLSGMYEKVRSLHNYLVALAYNEENYDWFDPSDFYGSITALRKMSPDAMSDKIREVLFAIEGIVGKMGSGIRYLNAYPYILAKGYHDEQALLRDMWLDQQRHGYSILVKHGKDRLDGFKGDIRSAYSEITFTRLFWVFVIGCVIGFVVETAVAYINRGVIESRQGMLYGPFSQIYGFGAVIMVLLLTPFYKRGVARLFISSAIVGGLFEVVSSLIQEQMLGTVSWKYSHEFMSFFGGRTSIKFMLFWGIMGTVFISSIYPRMVRMIDSIPARPKHFFTWVLAIFLSIDLALSCAAIDRWTRRQYDAAPRNQFEDFLDENYPNEFMEEIYPNMKLATDDWYEHFPVPANQ